MEEVVIGDICFEVEEASLDTLFESCALAVAASMVKLDTVSEQEEQDIELTHEHLDRLLMDFLDELIYLKDTEGFLLKRIEVTIEKKDSDGKSTHILKAKAFGEQIDRDKHDFEHDLKAITMHMFKLEKTDKGYYARVVIDI